MRIEKHMVGQKVLVRYMEDTDSDILGLGFLITSSIMWISNRGHVFCVRGIRLHPTGVFSNVLMTKKRHDNRKTSDWSKSDATKKGLENGTEENRIGQEGERRKSYSAAVIDGIKRKSRIFVGDSIVRKTDTRLSKEEDVVVCLPGARIEHVTERVEKIMGRGK